MTRPSRSTGRDHSDRISRVMRSRPSPAMAVTLAALFIALSGTAIASQEASTPDQAKASAQTKAEAKAAKKKAKRGKRGKQGPPGPSTGAAGGALTGSYPYPSLNVSGGPCANGQALTNVSASAALTCAPGVYSDSHQNVAAGPDAFHSNPTGNDNTAFGQSALFFNTTGNVNTALGWGALAYNDTGSGNTALGWGALLYQGYAGPGDNNTALGSYAGVSHLSGSDNIYIANEGGENQNESGTTRIGTIQNRAFIAGIRGTTTGFDNAVPVLIASNGQLGTTSSSRRYKTEIEALGDQSDPLMKLRPVSFRYREGSPALQYGLIAEQVAKVMPTLAVFSDQGLPETVQYQDLPVLLLNEVQKQRRQIKALQTQVDRLIRQARGG